jgi:hypothetical protein
VMHIDSNKFLITVCKPLQLTIQNHIERETQNELGIALQSQLNLLHSRGLVPTIIDIGGAGDYISEVDAKIWRIKELVSVR